MSETFQDICSFCAEIERESDHNLFHKMVGKDIGYKYLLRETDHFVVMPGIGSLMPGYLLIVPKAHILSFGHSPDDHDNELEEILSDLVEWHSSQYGMKTIIFEHGPVSFTKRGGSCTDHAHMHVVPVPESIDLLGVMYRDFPAQRVNSLANLRNQVKKDTPYLFLRHHDGSLHVCDAPNAKSQHLRRDLVRQLELGEVWDWAVYPGAEHIRATIEHFRKAN